MSILRKICLQYQSKHRSTPLNWYAGWAHHVIRTREQPAFRLRPLQRQLQEGSPRVFASSNPIATMNTFRFARSALRARPSMFSAPVQRRGYAEAVADKIKLSLTLPHQVRRTSDSG